MTARVRCSLRAADPAQGPDLHARGRCGRSCSAGCGSRSATSPSPRCAALRARRARRSPRSARARTCASWPAPAGSAFLARHAGVADRPARWSTRAGRVLGRHRGHHGFTVGQRKGLGVAAGEPLYVLVQGRAGQPGGRRPARGARDRTASRSPARAAPATARGSTASSCATARSRVPCTRRGARPAGSTITLAAEPAAGVAPGQTACLWTATGSSATAPSPASSSPPKLASDAAPLAPQRSATAFLTFFEERDHMRVPSASLVPSVLRPVRAADDRRHAAVQAVLPRARSSRRIRASPPARSAFARPTSTRSATPPATSRSSRCSATSRSATTSRRARSSIAWELSTQVFGLDPERIWITVFEGDDELGLGPDEEAIECWRAVGVPEERIVRPAALGELLAGRPDRPVRAVLGAVLRPRPRLRRPDGRPGDDTRALTSSSGTSSSCSTPCTRTARSSRCPKRNIDTGAGPGADGARSSRTCPRCTRPTSSGRWSSSASSLSGRRYGSDPVDHHGRCACWPTTAAR